ncbi:MAG: sensor histidine kinase, partial [Deinococcus sp.]
LPLVVNGQVRGVFNLTSLQPHHWTEAERALLETVVRSLGLATELAEQARRLREQHASLELRTTALESANEELEAFSYSVSHDLRTPVRHIVGFSELLGGVLNEALGENPDPKVARYLTVVREAAQRMNALIDAMLDLSRTSRLPLRLEPVNLAELVGEVRRELELDLGRREVRWELGSLPTVMADLDTLRQVMTNLISNALKYSRNAEVTRVEIWSEERPEELAVLVRDHGVGFDPRFADKLFGVFQRLHRHDEFEGTGVGLANVRRIVTRHGGRVWAEGEPGRGATFGFSLPRQADVPPA